MHRLFVAIRPPEVIRDQLIDLMADDERLRWQSEHQLHLTLRFIGEVERPLAEDIAAALQKLGGPAFELRLSGVGRFAQRRGGALWAGIAPKEPLVRLAAKIDRACVAAGLRPDQRAYHPHITLARWKGPEPNLTGFLRVHSGLTSDPWLVTGFTLYESHLLREAAYYEAVAHYPLG